MTQHPSQTNFILKFTKEWKILNCNTVNLIPVYVHITSKEKLNRASLNHTYNMIIKLNFVAEKYYINK